MKTWSLSREWILLLTDGTSNALGQVCLRVCLS